VGVDLVKPISLAYCYLFFEPQINRKEKKKEERK